MHWTWISDPDRTRSMLTIDYIEDAVNILERRNKAGSHGTRFQKLTTTQILTWIFSLFFSFIRLFVHLFIRSFCLFIHSFIHSHHFWMLMCLTLCEGCKVRCCGYELFRKCRKRRQKDTGSNWLTVPGLLSPDLPTLPVCTHLIP